MFSTVRSSLSCLMTVTGRLLGYLTMLACCLGLTGLGCGGDSKVKQIKRGLENVGQHAKDIESESEALPPSPLAPG